MTKPIFEGRIKEIAHIDIAEGRRKIGLISFKDSAYISAICEKEKPHKSLLINLFIS